MRSENVLKRKLAAGDATLGLWITLESPAVSELAALLGFDWVVLDMEHGPLDFKDVLAHVRALGPAGPTPLVRIPEVQQGTIKRALDVGAAGVILPQVTGPDDVERAVQFAKYPPRGIRGVSGERTTAWGLAMKETTGRANVETMVVPLIESVAAGEQIDAILDVPGVDAIFFGPADYSASGGALGEWEGPGIAARILAVKDRAVSRGFACGVMGTSVDNARMRRDQGFRMVGVASDAGLLIRGATEALRALR